MNINLRPSAPTDGQNITFIASASDNGSIARIEIWVQTEQDSALVLLQNCPGVTSCNHVGGPYSEGEIRYEARAWDLGGNSASTGVLIVVVSP